MSLTGKNSGKDNEQQTEKKKNNIGIIIIIPKHSYNHLGKGAENQNGNLRWHLPLGVRPPPPLLAKFPDIFLPHIFSFAIESYIYETDFTL